MAYAIKLNDNVIFSDKVRNWTTDIILNEYGVSDLNNSPRFDITILAECRHKPQKGDTISVFENGEPLAIIGNIKTYKRDGDEYTDPEPDDFGNYTLRGDVTMLGENAGKGYLIDDTPLRTTIVAPDYHTAADGTLYFIAGETPMDKEDIAGLRSIHYANVILGHDDHRIKTIIYNMVRYIDKPQNTLVYLLDPGELSGRSMIDPARLDPKEEYDDEVETLNRYGAR